MDYMTKPLSRQAIRSISKYMRQIFDVKEDDPFPVLLALDKLCILFNDTEYQIVNDNRLPPNVFACCYQKSDGGFMIEIKQTVYDGAYKNNKPFLSFICHEICHVFLFKIGYTPIAARTFENNLSFPTYCSVEWQAKALCGEVTIPYEATIGMTADEIAKKYHVTMSSAKYRTRQK